MAAPADASVIIATLHAKVLRKVSAETQQQFHGRAQASRSKKLTLSSTLRRRHLHLDIAFNVGRLRYGQFSPSRRRAPIGASVLHLRPEGL